MNKINSRAKGHNFERKVARLLREGAYNHCPGKVYRGQQAHRGTHEADVETPDHSIECKKGKTFVVEKAIQQAINTCARGKVPILAHMRDRGELLVTMRFDDWHRMLLSIHGRRKSYDDSSDG